MSTLVVIQSTPYGNTNAKDALDVLLTLAAFEQAPGLLLQGVGVHLLTSTQGPFKHAGKMLAALPMYDVEQLYVDNSAIAAQGISQTQLAQCPLDCQLLDQPAIGKLMASYQHVLVF